MSDVEKGDYLSDPTGAVPQDIDPLADAAGQGSQPMPPEQAPVTGSYAASEAIGAGPSAQEPLPPAGGAGIPPSTGRPFVTGGNATDDDRLMAALSWVSLAVLQLPLVSAVLLLSENNKNRPFQRYHAVTSIAFWLAAMLYEVLVGVAYLIVGLITAGCGLICLWPVFFVPHIIALYYAYEAYMGREPIIPGLTDFVRKQGWA